jgi:predicted pyridoxine 5'-phosphate oxidase superfamily flavin-nucleotide-binding protein
MMNKEMMEVIEKERAYVATATPDGVPNVVPIGYIKPIDDKTVLIADSYMVKSRTNLETNPKVSFVVQDVVRYPYQFKGSSEIFTDGEHFETVVNWVKDINPLAPKPKAAIVITIEEIYSVRVGDAGKKIV